MDENEVAQYVLSKLMGFTFSLGACIVKIKRKAVSDYSFDLSDFEIMHSENLVLLEKDILEKEIYKLIQNHPEKKTIFKKNHLISSGPNNSSILIGQTTYNKDKYSLIIPINYHSELVGIIVLFRGSKFENYYHWASLEPLIQTLAKYLSMNENSVKQIHKK